MFTDSDDDAFSLRQSVSKGRKRPFGWIHRRRRYDAFKRYTEYDQNVSRGNAYRTFYMDGGWDHPRFKKIEEEWKKALLELKAMFTPEQGPVNLYKTPRYLASQQATDELERIVNKHDPSSKGAFLKAKNPELFYQKYPKNTKEYRANKSAQRRQKQSKKYVRRFRRSN